MTVEVGVSHTNCVVVCPIYRVLESESELFSLINNRSKLRLYRWVFIGPTMLRDYVRRLSSLVGLDNIGFECFDEKFFIDIQGYNRLCKGTELYARFDSYEYMLVCQLDCLVFGESLEPWIKTRKSFYGAVLYSGYTGGEDFEACKDGRNGGLSLRRIPDFLSCIGKKRLVPLRAYRGVCKQGASCVYRIRMYASMVIFCMTAGSLQAKINEDLFWTICIPFLYPRFKVADQRSSMLFSVERVSPAQAEELTNNSSSIPFGCHAWERYNYRLWLKLIVKHDLVDKRCREFFEIDRDGIRLKESMMHISSILSSGYTRKSTR